MSASDLVTLKGGVIASIEVLRALWSLEDRGCDVRVADGGVLLVGPRERLTEADRAFISQHKPELIQLVQYAAQAVQ